MIKLTINGICVEVEEGTTILKAAASVGIRIPTLCYWEGINEVGACRVCVVEIEGSEKLSAACNTPAEDGMVVYTNSARALAARRTNVKLILSRHDCHCPTCPRNGSCALQSLAAELNIRETGFEPCVAENRWDMSFPLIRNASKCISCLRCVNICEMQSCNVWDLIGTGMRARVDIAENKTMTAAGCALCGQCITHCPVGALSERDDTDRLFDAIHDSEKTVVVQVAPAVRAAWGEGVGLPKELATEKRMAAAMRRLGADYVFDTNFAADLTIMEEGSEFIERMTHPGAYKMPMFTSCCPGWVRFVKLHYPEFAENLSTAKSPHQMLGAVTKSYFAEKLGKEAKDIFVVSIMPCVAKKYEAAVPELSVDGNADVDAVITTREFDKMLRTLSLDVAALPEEEFDDPLGSGTGAAVIFGATGGVMEAALRSAVYLLTGKNPDADSFKAVRGLEAWKEASYEVAGVTVRAAVVSGLGNARKLLEALKAGEVSYDFIEVMACPGGCIVGGGQPIHDGVDMAPERIGTLYTLDSENKLRFSHENADVQTLYREYLEKPLSHRSHTLLHTEQKDWTI